MDFDAVWFVAGDQGPGLDGDDDIAVWSVSGSIESAPPTGLWIVLSVNAVAQEFSDWFDAGSTDFDVSRENDGYDEVQECVEDAVA